MLNEGKLATRMRLEGQICCLCRIPLAPPHPMAPGATDEDYYRGNIDGPLERGATGTGEPT